MKHDNSEPQSMFAIRILQVLWRYSDENHGLTQKDIIEKLESDYGIVLERKAIKRALTNLNDMFQKDGLPLDIVPFVPKESKRRRGLFLQRPFDNSELRLLIDGIIASRHISADHTKQLTEKLRLLSSKNFSYDIQYVCSSVENLKTDNKELFLNIETILDAINNNKQITFDYNNYDENGKLIKTFSHQVSPQNILIKNQHYFLMAFNEKIKAKTNYKLDKVTNIRQSDAGATKLRNNNRKVVENYPYMFTDEPEKITFIADKGMTGEIFDWFGKTAKIDKRADGKYKVTVYTSPSAMLHWALQYIPSVEIASPDHLRKAVIEEIKKAVAVYKI